MQQLRVEHHLERTGQWWEDLFELDGPSPALPFPRLDVAICTDQAAGNIDPIYGAMFPWDAMLPAPTASQLAAPLAWLTAFGAVRKQDDCPLRLSASDSNDACRCCFSKQSIEGRLISVTAVN